MSENKGQGKNEKDQGKDDKKEATSWLEWIASGTGLVLAVGGIGYLLWNGFTSGDRLPAVQVQMERIVERDPGYTVEIRATNTSGSTAATVVVEGALLRNGKAVETSQATFQFIPGHSERQGGLYFHQNPRAFQLDLQPKSYVQP